ncbi:hypothetical protein COL30_12070 [Bacillus pseudomycoides]|uniref:Nuclease associated modular domain-containing protein n=1 Tax=Bacillus pseudomycoides TaxID=64104 RepID=A0A2B4MK78_9BACI|nr:NUMOD3 domain-containing DNA-binding protein [Bacillus pseudomycoides]PEJ68135.1 hypothetical protein CN680_26755 [Bacillus pseudomycoides]PEM73270.1 hypothetical protein CN613_02080 [Bacillus pseudomycoides]PEP61118.1 hypothetical protein CN591_18200 [Bacillus pseudomycoides]PFW68028.1 hypothetical protein COL25_14045 [Bacillus pseudomycoides]PFW80020.1 hypothetical protein COL30_12070 [Bacillus pseudomycoides]
MSPKGFKHSEETKHKISKSLQGRNFSTETRNKMGASKQGHPFWGKKDYTMSEEAKENIKKGINEKRNTEEYRKKLSDSKKGEKNHRSKLTKDDVIKIRMLSEQGLSQYKLSERFKVSRSSIADIVNYRTWKDI